MKWCKKLGWTALVISLVALLSTATYGMGRDITKVIPEWLVHFTVGGVSFAIIVIVVVIFALGIVHIKEWFKDSQGG